MKRFIIYMLIIILSISSIFILGSCSEKNKQPEIRAMSYNVRTYSIQDTGDRSLNKRLIRIKSRITSVNPDVFGLQECLPVHKDYLTENLPEYDCILCYRDNGLISEATPIFYKREVFDLLDSGHFWLSETPTEPSKISGSACNRICTWAKLKKKNSDFCFYYYNTHIDYNSEPQQKQISILLSQMVKDMPVLLTADFNFTFEAPSYATITELMTDSYSVSPELLQKRTYNAYESLEEEKGKPIDYMFVRNLTPTNTKIYNDDETIWGKGIFASDHFAVSVELK